MRIAISCEEQRAVLLAYPLPTTPEECRDRLREAHKAVHKLFYRVMNDKESAALLDTIHFEILDAILWLNDQIKKK